MSQTRKTPARRPRATPARQRSVRPTRSTPAPVTTAPQTPEPDAEAHAPDDASIEQAYKHLTHDQLGQILRYSADGMSDALIAEALGVHRTTICRARNKLGSDSVDLALHRLKASALPTAERVIDVALHANAREAMLASKLVFAATGVTKEDTGAPINVAVVIGMDSSTLPSGAKVVSSHEPMTINVHASGAGSST